MGNEIVTDIGPAAIAAYLNLALVYLLKITCFIIGYLTIKLGYQLLLKGVTGEFKFIAKYKGVKADIVSASPGLLFVLLGSVIIIFAMSSTKSIEFAEKSSSPNIEKKQEIENNKQTLTDKDIFK